MTHLLLLAIPMIAFFLGLIVALNVWYYRTYTPEERKAHRHDWEGRQW